MYPLRVFRCHCILLITNAQLRRSEYHLFSLCRNSHRTSWCGGWHSFASGRARGRITYLCNNRKNTFCTTDSSPPRSHSKKTPGTSVALYINLQSAT